MKLLYVEDSEDDISTMKRIVRYFGHDLVVAVTGEQGNSLISERPDLVLVDINLPDTSGLELVRRWRTERHLMPIVAITADLLLCNEAMAIDAGCTAFIPKPYTVEIIQDLLVRFSR